MDGPEFLIAQFFENPIRREAKNVGVVLIHGTECCWQFIGTKPGERTVDRRKVKWTKHADIYQQWVNSWTEEIGRGTSGLLKRLSRSNGGNFDVIYGGFISPSGATIQQECSDLYNLIIEAAPAQDVIEVPEVEQPLAELTQEIFSQFEELDIVDATVHSHVPHPVTRNAHIPGKHSSYTPSFYQANGRPYVMEAINFATRAKKYAVYHAGYADSMFRDLRALQRETDAILIYRAGEEELSEDAVASSLDVLKANGVRTVNWTQEDEREPFLKERVKVAYASEA